jgi:hypothetical protein
MGKQTHVRMKRSPQNDAKTKKQQIAAKAKREKMRHGT